MTAAGFDPAGAPMLPRHTVALSVALHAAALLLLAGPPREEKPDLPPIVASLRLTVPAPTADVASPPAAAAQAGPLPRPAAPRPVREDHAAALAAVPRNETAPLPPQAAAPGERAPREEPATTAAAASQPVPAPAPTPMEGVVLDDYGRALAERLAHQQQYPRLAALRGWEGEVRLRLRVARKGSLVAVQVVHSSGHEILDRHALQLVQGAALPPPPDALGDREIQVVVPIHYKLQKST